MKTINQHKQKMLTNSVLAMTCLSAVLGLAGCEQKGSAEQAGKKIDTAAESAEQKIGQAAEQAEKKIEAVKESVTEKTQAAGEFVDDAAVTAGVKAAILNDPLLNTSNIEVTTSQGIVKLSGTVNSEQIVAKAVEVAGSQKNVKSVQSELLIKK
jgi:hyperosmotically inducible protein